MGGDTTVPPQRSFGLNAPLPEAAKLDDEIAPGEIKTILDCDSSQLEAIVASRRGVSFVLDGPPGTGKSQTIANIIADALSEGRRVLFVSEKVSALEVVKRRLDDCGLGDFCLECHSSKANRKAVLEELKYCLDLPVEVYDDASPKLEEAKQKRNVLNDYVRSIHRRRPPLGLSPYELYGQVSRSHRLGHAVKSRCDLPGIENLDRLTFERWLELLARAQDSAEVIKSHRQHPWRGCYLKARTLTLSDDLDHHLGVLAQAFDIVDQALSPLRHKHLFESEPHLGNLNLVFQSLKTSLDVPLIPASWFAAAPETAKALLQRHNAYREIERCSQQLVEFNEDVEGSFPHDQVNGLAFPLEETLWLRRLHGAVPTEVRQQHSFLLTPTNHVRKLRDSVQLASNATAQLLGLLPIPVRADLPISKLPAVVDLARSIAAAFPLHREWLIPENWPQLREASQSSLTNLEECSRIAKRLQSRLSVPQLVELSRSHPAPQKLHAAWTSLEPLCLDGSTEGFLSLQGKLLHGVNTLLMLNELTKDALQSLGIDWISSPTQQFTASFAKAIPQILGMNRYLGQWSDSTARSKLMSVINEVLADVRETAEVRQQLEPRLSHRAFKAAAAPTIDRVVVFQSTWKRLFGGFKAYRIEVADLFKDGTPPTGTLLADLMKLRTWHRRIGEVSQAADAVATFLPQPFAIENPAEWVALQADLQVFDKLAVEFPDLVSQMPAGVCAIDRQLLESAEKRIAQLTQELDSTFADTAIAGLISRNMPFAELIQNLTRLSEASQLCQSARAAATKCYSSPPRNFATIVEDVSFATQFVQLIDDITRRFDRSADLMPKDANPHDFGLWKKVAQSVQVAERLGKLTRNLETYHDVLCEEGSLKPKELAGVADSLESACRELERELQSLPSQMALLPDAPSAVELKQRPLSELLSVTSTALALLTNRLATLDAILPVLKPETDIEISALPRVLSALKGLRAAQSEFQASEAILAGLNIQPEPHCPVEEHAKAVWLQQKAAEGPVPALVQAVASSSATRAEVADAIIRIKSALGPEFSSSLKFLKTVLSFQATTRRGDSIPQMTLGILSDYLQGLRSEMGSLDEWLKFSRWEREMDEQGFSGVVNELLEGSYQPDEAKSVIAARYFRMVFDRLAREERLLSEFDLENHEQSRERFRKLDEWEIRAASSRIRQYQLGRDDRPRSGWFADAKSELGVLQKEIQKKRRQLPLRKLFAEIPSVLQRLKPCIMMSPLSVSTFLQSEEIRFDLVIFDEASQVFPWDAVGAIYRGTQLIVAGDEKQLPPTNFFNRGDIETEDEDENDIGDFESILSLCKSIGMPGRRLRWHYRSKREPLIAFSNRHFYSGDLVTFPSIRDASSDAVRLEFVPQGRWVDRVNRPEAERVTDLIIRHLRTRPETSLGIIAFNQSHQGAIEDSIYERRRKYPEVDALFHTGLSEPLFVKNLENVQGDERDVIILSMGYGYNEAGKFLKNFGPLTKAGGERRLNVAVTRAREEVILVASVKAADLDLSGSTSQGSRLLKGYLEYAERGVDSLAREITSITGEVESPFELEVATALIRHGLHPAVQVGCGGFRIDLALKHPQRPGEFCLGIECDGATYHSSKTARDRDRIRQTVLEHLGWKMIRIWSTDWIRNPDRQIARVLAAFEKASAQSSNRTSGIEANSDEVLDDLKLRIDVKAVSTDIVFSSIREVPEGHLHNTFQTIVKRGGAIDLEGLIQQSSRNLGFGRTGKQIRQRLEKAIHEQLQIGHLRWVGDRISSGTEENDV
ncbi:AAA domain-containing protein [Anatilimnocola sp. NA78]|uniref:AAA domain-containing protein n=1 Tax=Anatilimnocola sp. NA78 TaxID=3415683 RepID=UPI003CE58082